MTSSRSPVARPGPIDRIFSVLASPWLLAAGLTLGALIELVEVQTLLGAGTEATTTWSARALAVGVVLVSAVAMAAARAIPALVGTTKASADAILPDIVFAAEVLDPATVNLSDTRVSWFRGATAVAGAVLIVLGGIGFLGLPLVGTTGLQQGGTLDLVAGRPADAAQVVREGVSVKENLAGSSYTLEEVTTSGNPEVIVTVNQVQTGEATRLTLRPAEPVAYGDHVLRVRAIEPSLRAAGIVADVTDTEQNRSFEMRLTPGRAVQDPEGPGVFSLRRVEANWAGGAGFGASGTVQESEDGATAEFLAFEQRPDFDKLHRNGRYHVRFKAPIEGHRVTVAIHEPSGDNRLPVLLILFALGVALLASSRHVGAVLVRTQAGEDVAVASLNEGGRTVRTLAGVVGEDA